MFNNARVLITGGTGSWGQTLTTHLFESYNPKEVIIYSRGELQQVLMARKFEKYAKKIKYVIGDIRDFETIKSACVGVDYIFHLAALKHVPVCEDHPQEAVKTNIQGTINIINAAIQNKVKKVIDVSTDKAVEPLNLYGMTKATGEKLIIQANNISDHTRFVCIRGGNVMGSNGSVIPFFKDQIKSGTVKITDFQMTRYFLTLDEAINLLFKAAEFSAGGETFVMNMPACYIKELAEVLIEDAGVTVPIIEIGMRPGEKLDEVLVSKHEAVNAYVFDSSYFVILPTLAINDSEQHYVDIKSKFPKVDFVEFSSRTKIMSKEEIKIMLKNGGFI